MTYAEYVDLMVVMLSAGTSSEASFVVYLPQMIAYAENRIYRDLDFLHTMTALSTVNMTPGTRSVAVPATITIVQSAAVITPASTAPSAGTRNPLQRVSVEFLNFVCPTGAQGLPLYYAMADDENLSVGPTPDAAYKIDVYGQFQPAALSVTNTTTFLTEQFPELFVAASLIFGFGEQQNYGAMSDVPQAAQSWENQYQLLKAGVDQNEDRKKAWSSAWQAMTPTPGAKDPRT